MFAAFLFHVFSWLFLQNANQQLLFSEQIASGGCTGTLGNHTAKGANGNTTTTAISTTGANLLILGIGSFSRKAVTTDFSDSAGNTWTALTLSITDLSGSNQRWASFFFVASPTTSATHTISWTSGAGLFEIMNFAAFTGPSLVNRGSWAVGTTYALNDVVSATDNHLYMSLAAGNTGNNPVSVPASWRIMDAEAGTGSGTTLQAGSLTQPNTCGLVLSLIEGNAAGQTFTVNSGFTIADQVTGTGTNVSGALGYLFQSPSAAVNPTWTSSMTDFMVATGLFFNSI